MGFVDHFAIYLDQFLCHLLGIALGTADVVNAFEDNQLLYATLSEDVAVETLHGRIGKTIAQHAVAADTQIEYAHLTA